MKYTNYFCLAIAMLLFINCTQEEIEAPLKKITISATVESDMSKSTVGYDSQFLWADEDQILLLIENDLYGAWLSDGAGTSDGEFTLYSEMVDINGITAAFYPPSNNHTIEGNNLNFDMPDTYWPYPSMTNTYAPLLSLNPIVDESEGVVELNFSHLAGVFHFKFYNAPIGTSSFTLSLGNKRINGIFNVSLNNKPTQIITENSEVVNPTSICFDPLVVSGDVDIYVPVPVGEYDYIDAKLYAGETIVGSWSGPARNVVSRKSIVQMPPITFNKEGESNVVDVVEVSTVDELNSAIEEGGYIKLITDIYEVEGLNVSKDVILDLNGHMIILNDETTILADEETSFVINNTSAKSGKITGNGVILTADYNSSIIVSENVTINSTNFSNCIHIPESADGATVTVKGNVLTTGGESDIETDAAIFIEGQAKVYIKKGAEIFGPTGVQINSGELYVTDGRIRAKGNALSIVECRAEDKIKVNIRGGEFVGRTAIYENVESNVDNVELVTEGGYPTFIGDIYSKNFPYFIGGAYINDLSLLRYFRQYATAYLISNQYIADDYRLEGKDLYVDLNGYNIELADGKSLIIEENSSISFWDSTEGVGKITGSGCIFKPLSNSQLSVTVDVHSTNNKPCIMVSDDVCNVNVYAVEGLLLSEGNAPIRERYAPIYISENVGEGVLVSCSASVKNPVGPAIQMDGNAKLSVSSYVGSVIEGTTGVLISAGELNVSGGNLKIKATGTPSPANTVSGAALAITTHNYNKPLKVNIEAISSDDHIMFEGARALYEEGSYEEGELENRSILVRGANLKGEVYSENFKEFISSVCVYDESAFNYLADYSSIFLCTDLYDVDPENLGKLYVLDLGNKTLGLADGKSITINEDHFLDVKDGTLKGTGDLLVLSNNSGMVVNFGAVLESSSRCIVIPDGVKDVDVTMMSGDLTSTSTPAIFVGENSLSTLHLYNGSITTNNGSAVLVEGNSQIEMGYEMPNMSLFVNGTTSAVEMRAGNLTVRQSTLNATGNGGAAIRISQHEDDSNVSVKTVMGEYNGTYSIYEEDLENFSGRDKILLDIKDGQFNGRIYSQNCPSFISGGTFTTQKSFNYLADGASVKLGTDLTLQQPIRIPVNATIDLQNHTVEAVDCDAFDITGSLCIDGRNDAQIIVGGSDEGEPVYAVRARGGSVSIDGGYYMVYPQDNGDRNGCMFADYNNGSGGEIDIFSGKFEYVCDSSELDDSQNGHKFLLNCAEEIADAKRLPHICVSGGEFKNHVPSYEDIGEWKVSLSTYDPMRDFYVYNGDEVVTEPHSSGSDVWYSVKPIMK